MAAAAMVDCMGGGERDAPDGQAPCCDVGMAGCAVMIGGAGIGVLAAVPNIDHPFAGVLLRAHWPEVALPPGIAPSPGLRPPSRRI